MTDSQSAHPRPRFATPFSRRQVVGGLVGAPLVSIGTSGLWPLAANQVEGGSSIIVGQTAEDTSLDPARAGSGTGLNVLLNIYDVLMMVDEEGVLQPALAASAEAVADTTWEVVLRDDVTFHNGDKLTADAVKWSVDRVINDDQSPWVPYIRALQSVEVVDDLTLRLHTDGPAPTLMMGLQVVLIQNPKYFEELGQEAYGQQPMGTGPFQFVEWTAGDRIVLEAFDGHWRGRPTVDRVEFRTIPDQSSLVSALRAGEVDLITSMSPDAAEKESGSDDLKVLTVPSNRSMLVALDTRIEPFNKREVRQALNYATNVDEIIEFILLGYGVPIPTLLSPVHWGYNDTIEPYPHDPERAKELLAEAGYPDGLQFTMFAPSGRYVRDRDVAQALVAQWANAGIQVDLQIMEWNPFLARWGEKDLSPAFMIGYGTAIFDSGAGFSAFANTGAVGSLYENPEVDQLTEKGLTTLDPEARKEIYQEVNQILFDDASHVFLYQQIDIYGAQARVEWTPRPDERVWLFPAEVTGD